jgi:hypothetical protein
MAVRHYADSAIVDNVVCSKGPIRNMRHFEKNEHSKLTKKTAELA